MFYVGRKSTPQWFRIFLESMLSGEADTALHGNHEPKICDEKKVKQDATFLELVHCGFSTAS